MNFGAKFMKEAGNESLGLAKKRNSGQRRLWKSLSRFI